MIEVKELSPDRKEVRLEIIKENESSKKVSIGVEMIKKEWKVADFYVSDRW